jgi:hypothetical protein
MPHLDVIDELNRVRDALLKQITSHAGKRGSSLLTDFVSREFAELIAHVDEERREWESVLNFLMERENEEDDKRERPA